MSETQQVWDEFSGALRAFIRRRVADQHAADDLLQEVFLRIHDKLDSLSDADRLAAWLYRLTRNVIADHHRSRAHAGLDRTAADVEPFDAPDDSGDANLNQDVAEWLHLFVARLPNGYREAVRLSELEGVSQAELARRIGLSPSGARSRVQRGRKMLKELLFECCHFDLDRSGNVIQYEARSTCAGCCDSAVGRRPRSPDQCG